MTGILRFLLNIIVTAIALYVVARFVPGVSISPPDDPWAFIWVALVFIVVNAVVGPVLRLLGLPITVLTLGLFALVINALLFLLTGWLSEQLGLGLRVEDFVAALIGAVVMGITTWVLGLVLGTVGLRTKG
ncbi:phage holin family protein [Corynebacterium sp. YIM 101645]|uniref:Phage holin family protein n=1 Tax=Corynebacterium lemuris TaxID=1859292 RepID=A0ABT2FW08_9CORY|nr:phage holin family protein [Corynebacterium lemuris]MCS5478237.1 phage holin family protein [Corynebacterium lemuris]